jgi:hypothetical protein
MGLIRIGGCGVAGGGGGPGSGPNALPLEIVHATRVSTIRQ